MQSARSFFVAGTLFGLVAQAAAVDVPIAGSLAVTDPVYNRTTSGAPPAGLSAVGTAVSYDVFPFFVTANNTYLLETLSAAFTTGTADDTFISVYRNTFNPAAALTNVVAADDDAGPGNLSTLSTALLAGTQYFLVVTSFANAQFGPYTGHLNSTTALGQVVLGAVPELPTSVLMLTPLVIGGLVAARRRRAG